MEVVEYTDPSGDNIADPTPEQVVGAMRLGDDYWGPYSPMGWLKRGNPPTNQLIFIRHPRRGWYLEYRADGLPERQLVAVDPSAVRHAWVEHGEGGQTYFFAARCFLPPPAAERAVADFLAGRDPSVAGGWEPYRWGTHKRLEPPPDGLIQWLLSRRPVVERAEPAA
jgi:hypothetical protein